MSVKLTPSQKIQILKAESLYPVMREILLRENMIDRDKEHFWLVCLNNSYKILMIELISLGSVRTTVVDPMDIFSFALQKRAVKLIMVHNHPGGMLTPSDTDIDITERMFAIGHFLQMPVVDHLIISPKTFYSFKEEGLIDKIRKEKKYDLTFKEVDKLNAQLKKLTQDKARAEKQVIAAEKKLETEKKEQAKEIARNLLVQGISVDMIIIATGLTKKQVETLRK